MQRFIAARSVCASIFTRKRHFSTALLFDDTQIQVSLSLSQYMYACIYVCMYVCMYVCLCVCVCVFLFMFVRSKVSAHKRMGLPFKFLVNIRSISRSFLCVRVCDLFGKTVL